MFRLSESHCSISLSTCARHEGRLRVALQHYLNWQTILSQRYLNMPAQRLSRCFQLIPCPTTCSSKDKIDCREMTNILMMPKGIKRMRLFILLLSVLVSSAVWAGIPATPVMTLYQFNGPLEILCMACIFMIQSSDEMIWIVNKSMYSLLDLVCNSVQFLLENITVSNTKISFFPVLRDFS